VQQVFKVTNWQAVQYDTKLPDHVAPTDKGGTSNDRGWFSAKVPGAIHYVLRAPGKF
jgi:hypothetical protein